MLMSKTTAKDPEIYVTFFCYVNAILLWEI